MKIDCQFFYKGELKIMRKKNIKKQIWIDEKEDELLKRKSKEAGLNESLKTSSIRSLRVYM